MQTRMELMYRRTAAEGASQIGLILALYDTLTGDLQRAAAAVRESNIEQRCAELHHAFMVMGRLESWVESGSDDPLAKSLVTFYGYLRAKMMEASLKQSASMLDNLVELVVQVRSAWQQRESAEAPAPALVTDGSAGQGTLSQTA